MDWFDTQTAGLIGAIAGSAMGVLFGGIGGPMAGYFAPRGKHKPLVMGYFIAWGVLGVIALAVGLVAVFSDQPQHVYYPFLMVGGLCALLSAILTPVIAKQYRRADERKLDAEQFRTT